MEIVPAPTADLLDLIRTAQQQAGIEDHYWDLWGVRHETSAEAAASLLGAMGYAVDSTEALAASLAKLQREQESRMLPETLVVRVSEEPLKLPVRASQPYTIEIFLEGTTVGNGTPTVIAWRDSEVVPKALPLGYHFATISSGGVKQSCHLIVCPDRAYLAEEGRKFAGLGVFLPGVHDDGSWGCGDFRALGRLAEWAARDLKVHFIALNPLHAIHNRYPFNTSPYLPNSLLYRNFIYLDIETLEGFGECADARALLASGRVRGTIEALKASDLVDYEGVARLKREFLELLFEWFLRRHGNGSSERGRAFAAFRVREGEPLEAYALHCALDEYFHARDPDVWNFPAWPEEYRSFAASGSQAFFKTHHRQVLFHSWVQWQIDEQLAAVQRRAAQAGMAIGLFHDLPLATDRYGAELWAHGEFYLKQGGVGAPPDAIAPHGQDWGFPPPDREAHRRSGYQHFARTIRAAVRDGGALRMDHVMRLFRLYTIPPGKSAMDGVYVTDYARDLLGVVALESVRNQAIVVGEDLGTVAPGVRETLGEIGVLGYRLLYFERESDTRFRAPGNYPPLALVSTTTHDLPTLAGFWLGRDIELRRECGLIRSNEEYERERHERLASKQGILDAIVESGLLPEGHSHEAAHYPELTGELHNAIIGFLAQTPSMLLTVNQEDLTKETEQQNLPGTVSQYPNWRRKMRLSLEELFAEHDHATMMRNWIERTGRV